MSKNEVQLEDADEVDSGFDQSFVLNLTLLHIVLLSQIKMSFEKKAEVKGIPPNEIEAVSFLEHISDDYWKKKVTFVQNKMDELKTIVTKEESWILDATCFHLAAKFNPKGLHILLSYLKRHKKPLLEDIYGGEQGFGVTPLHVAAAKVDDSRCTRYFNTSSINL